MDCNSIQKLKTVEDTIGSVNWRDRWQAFGWEVAEVDGHDIEALYRVLSTENEVGKPRLVIAKTIKGKGVSIMENDPKGKGTAYFCRRTWYFGRRTCIICREHI